MGNLTDKEYSKDTFQKMIYDQNAIIPIIVMNWLIKGQRNCAFYWRSRMWQDNFS